MSFLGCTGGGSKVKKAYLSETFRFSIDSEGHFGVQGGE